MFLSFKVSTISLTLSKSILVDCNICQMPIWLFQELYQKNWKSWGQYTCRLLKDLSWLHPLFHPKLWERDMLQKIKTTSNCAITTVLSRVGKRVTVRVGKISLRVGSCPPLPTLSYATGFRVLNQPALIQIIVLSYILSHLQNVLYVDFM